MQLQPRDAGTRALAAAPARWLTSNALAASDPVAGRPLNHELLRDATQGRRTLVRADEQLHDFKPSVFKASLGPGLDAAGLAISLLPQHVSNPAPSMTQPDPASQLCQNWAFSLSLMFRGSNLNAGLLRKALQAVVVELPVLAGRKRVRMGSPMAATCRQLLSRAS